MDAPPTPLVVHQVDAFTDRPFRGNPAAVCVLAGEVPAVWMQEVAREMNLSETAFLAPGGDAWRLRWFTPVTEVDLCGHATLASAHVLWERGALDGEAPARFDTRSGRLSARRRGEWIEMDFPADPPRESAAPDGLGEALGAAPVRTARSRLYHLVELAGEEELRALEPDFAALRRLVPEGLVATAPAATPGFDFVSRFFAPAYGIDEDPVTGSAHCLLGPWWDGRAGSRQMTAYQASPRGGTVRVEVRGDRVLLAGQAVTVAELRLTPGASAPEGSRR